MLASDLKSPLLPLPGRAHACTSTDNDHSHDWLLAPPPEPRTTRCSRSSTSTLTVLIPLRLPPASCLTSTARVASEAVNRCRNIALCRSGDRRARRDRVAERELDAFRIENQTRPSESLTPLTTHSLDSSTRQLEWISTAGQPRRACTSSAESSSSHPVRLSIRLSAATSTRHFSCTSATTSSSTTVPPMSSYGPCTLQNAVIRPFDSRLSSAATPPSRRQLLHQRSQAPQWSLSTLG